MIIEQYNVDQKLALNGYILSKIEPKNDNPFDKFIKVRLVKKQYLSMQWKLAMLSENSRYLDELNNN